MADKPEEKKQEAPMVQVPQADLTKIMESIAESDRKVAELEAQLEGVRQNNAAASTTDEPKLREKKNFEPKFRTVRIRKYPMAGDYENQGYIIGWSNRGAYQVVDKSGVAPQIVDMLDVQFLGHEKNAEGKLKFESIPLLSMYNKGVQVHCKILDKKVEPRKEPTGEEIDVTVYDPKHGMMATGDKIDGYTAYSDVTYTIQIPGVEGPTVVDETFVN